MRAMQSIGAAASVCLMGSMALAQSLSPNGVKTLAPQGAIQTTGTWNVGTRAGDFIYIAGMRGIDPKSNTLVAGDGDHYAATVLSETFRGKSRVQQHQLVYDALKEEMGGRLHALALQTGTPEQGGNLGR